MGDKPMSDKRKPRKPKIRTLKPGGFPPPPDGCDAPEDGAVTAWDGKVTHYAGDNGHETAWALLQAIAAERGWTATREGSKASIVIPWAENGQSSTMEADLGDSVFWSEQTLRDAMAAACDRNALRLTKAAAAMIAHAEALRKVAP